MINKNKYSAIFALCCMLSCGIDAAASSSSSTGDQRRVFRDYLTNPEPQVLENPESMQLCSLSGDVNDMSMEFQPENNNFRVTKGNEVFELPIGNVYLFYEKNRDRTIDLRLVKFILDSSDKTKAVFMLLNSYTDVSCFEMRRGILQYRNLEIQQKQDKIEAYLMLKSNGFDYIANVPDEICHLWQEGSITLLDYILENPKEAVSLIRKHIDKIDTLYSSLNPNEALAILREDAGLLDSTNLPKFFQSPDQVYNILSDTETTVDQKIALLGALR